MTFAFLHVVAKRSVESSTVHSNSGYLENHLPFPQTDSHVQSASFQSPAVKQSEEDQRVYDVPVSSVQKPAISVVESESTPSSQKTNQKVWHYC